MEAHMKIKIFFTIYLFFGIAPSYAMHATTASTLAKLGSSLSSWRNAIGASAAAASALLCVAQYVSSQEKLREIDERILSYKQHSENSALNQKITNDPIISKDLKSKINPDGHKRIFGPIVLTLKESKTKNTIDLCDKNIASLKEASARFEYKQNLYRAGFMLSALSLAIIRYL